MTWTLLGILGLNGQPLSDIAKSLIQKDETYMSGKLKTVFYEQQNYFEKMMGIMLEWYHLLIGMQTTVLLTMVFLGIAVLLIDDLIRSKENVRTVD